MMTQQPNLHTKSSGKARTEGQMQKSIVSHQKIRQSVTSTEALTLTTEKDQLILLSEQKIEENAGLEESIIKLCHLI